LLEYQFESYNLFQRMLQGVREKVTEYALRVTVVTRENRTANRRNVREGRDMLLPGSHAEDMRAAESAGDAKREPAKRGQKIGRNDPCPCGSGKKYKHCCGRGNK
jgi:preprotein translocase subunit SecA